MPLSDLASALAAATGPSRELDERIATEVFGWCQHPSGEFWTSGIVMSDAFELPELTRSLDAIAGAVDQRWRLFRWEVMRGGERWSCAVLDKGDLSAEGRGPVGDNGSIALSLAAVRLALREAGDE